MAKAPATRVERARAAVARMPHLPPLVAERVRAAFEVQDFPERGVFAALDEFFRRLHDDRCPLEPARTGHFRAVGTTRSRLRTRVRSLGDFAPEVRLAPEAEAEAMKEWDRWLNATDNTKPRKPRRCVGIALLPEAWPASWQAALPRLDEVARDGDPRLGRLAPKACDSVVQAVG